MAFQTFQANLIDGPESLRFSWPSWLVKRAWSIDGLLVNYQTQLIRLAGDVDLIAGGPPCQGFSFAGKRRKSDPRNMLFTRYARLVETLKPKALLVENVPGMGVIHGARGSRGRPPQPFSKRLMEKLDEIGYASELQLLDASAFGVPQRRPRLFIIGLKKALSNRLTGGIKRVFELLELEREKQNRQSTVRVPVSASDAISDLETSGRALVPCEDTESPKGFVQVAYAEPRTAYQRLMHGQMGAGKMSSLRLARHSDVIVDRFTRILDECPKGVRMNDKHRKRFGLLKHRVYPMDPDEPAPTITTLPDDVLHYKEPRILTVRECARLQSFPDWFEFHGKYTTGGDRRRKECPRYTQVGNAVPPLLAQAIGRALAAAIAEASINPVLVLPKRRISRAIALSV